MALPILKHNYFGVLARHFGFSYFDVETIMIAMDDNASLAWQESRDGRFALALQFAGYALAALIGLICAGGIAATMSRLEGTRSVTLEDGRDP